MTPLGADTPSAPRTVVVTGAAGNLGRAVAEAFARRGDNLVLVGRRASLERAYAAESATRMFAVADLLDPAQLKAALSVVQERFGDVHVLCNIAGGFRMDGAVHDTGDDAWQAMYDVNVKTLLNAVRAVVPRMRAAGRGFIVNVASATALRSGANVAPYAASKSAVVRITEAMAAELKAHGINVNCVLPTTIDTPENRAAMPTADPARWVKPEDIANVIAFLASDAARAIQGAAIPVAGAG